MCIWVMCASGAVNTLCFVWKLACITFQSLIHLGFWLNLYYNSCTIKFSSSSSYSPRVLSRCINICVKVKNAKHRQPYHRLDTHKYCTHWYEWVALLLRLLCFTQVRRPAISESKQQRQTDKQTEKQTGKHTEDTNNFSKIIPYLWNRSANISEGFKTSTSDAENKPTVTELRHLNTDTDRRPRAHNTNHQSGTLVSTSRRYPHSWSFRRKSQVILIADWLVRLFVFCSFSFPCLGGGDSSVVRAPDPKGRGFESLLERRENFLLQGQLSVLTLISVSVPPPCYHSST